MRLLMGVWKIDFRWVCVALCLCLGCDKGEHEGQKVVPKRADKGISKVLDVVSLNAFFLPHPAKRFHNPSCRARELPSVLGAYDVIALQETFDRVSSQRVAEALAKSHPHQLVSLPVGGWKLNGGVGLLSRYPIRVSKVIEYDACHGMWSDCRARRGAIMATVEAPGGEVDVVVTHLNAGGAASHAARLLQLEQLKKEMVRQGFGQGQTPALLLGDLNVNGISPKGRSVEGGLTPWGQMLQALGHPCPGQGCPNARPADLFWRFHSPWPASPKGTSEANTYVCLGWNLGGGCRDASEPGYWMDRARLDYALWWEGRAGSYEPLSTRHVSVPGEACGLNYLSDHRAVHVKLRLP